MKSDGSLVFRLPLVDPWFFEHGDGGVISTTSALQALDQFNRAIHTSIKNNPVKLIEGLKRSRSGRTGIAQSSNTTR
jgi:hypothetical protein